MPHHEENNFSAPAEIVNFAALLFDMDGTIIDSTPAIVKYWQQTGREIGVDGDGELELSDVKPFPPSPNHKRKRQGKILLEIQIPDCCCCPGRFLVFLCVSVGTKKI